MRDGFPLKSRIFWDHSALASTAMQEIHVTNKCMLGTSFQLLFFSCTDKHTLIRYFILQIVAY